MVFAPNAERPGIPWLNFLDDSRLAAKYASLNSWNQSARSLEILEL